MDVIDLAELDAITGAGFRDTTFALLTTLSLLQPNPNGLPPREPIIQQPIMQPPRIEQIQLPRK